MYRLLLVIALILSACGPVQFSAPTSESSSNIDNNGTSNTGPTYRTVHYNNSVVASNNKLDIVLIVDDSNSMLTDNQKLASKLSDFVTSLQTSNIDWQMCATVTRALPTANGGTAWGASIYWQNSSTASQSLGLVLKKTSSSNLSSVFTHTMNYIGAGWANSDDERGIKAAYNHVYNGDLRYSSSSGCYRADSAIAYIIISDEDERSIGGDSSQQVYDGELKTLESEDQPQVFVDYVKTIFGSDRRFTVNSIIVNPGDTACKTSQDAGAAKSHYGFKYAELSNLTGGGIGSICASNFATNLNLFLDKIIDSLSSVPLECAPYGSVNVSVTPSSGTVTSRVEGMSLVFTPPVAAGKTIDLTYQCEDSRTPSSVKGQQAIPYQKSEGFFASIISFFKNLF